MYFSTDVSHTAASFLNTWDWNKVMYLSLFSTVNREVCLMISLILHIIVEEKGG